MYVYRNMQEFNKSIIMHFAINGTTNLLHISAGCKSHKVISDLLNKFNADYDERYILLDIE